MDMLKKLLAIALLAVFGLPFATPLLALSAPADANLPLCCRRNGAHHCAGMGMREAAESAPHFRRPVERCPYAPATVSAAANLVLAAPSSKRELFTVRTTAHLLAQSQDVPRLASARSHQQRGPPALAL